MKSVAENAGTSLWPEMLNVAGGLLLVVVLIFALSWLARKSGRLNAMAGDRIQVVGSRSIGGRERLLVVEFAGREILLGVTATTITRLSDGASGGRDRGFAERLEEARGDVGEG